MVDVNQAFERLGVDEKQPVAQSLITLSQSEFWPLLLEEAQTHMLNCCRGADSESDSSKRLLHEMARFNAVEDVLRQLLEITLEKGE